ncbi:MAG: invasion protein CiaB [Candidatus Gracilibacteria bacterium]|nr:invasion protein CiaB [Candidatus Gracilibacteria bacterium]
MNTKKIIQIQNKIFSEVKNLWEISEQGNKKNIILDSFLDELNMKQTPENRFIAYSRISELRVEPLELFLDNILVKINTPFKNNKKAKGNGDIKIPNKLNDKRKTLNKAYNYVKRIYEDLGDKFIYELEKDCQQRALALGINSKGLKPSVDSFELQIFKGTLNVGKAFNNFMPVWENAIIKQNEILDKMFEGNSEKIMNFLRSKNLLEIDENGNETDRAYSVILGGKIFSYFDAFNKEINGIIFALDDFIDNCRYESCIHPEKEQYINYLTAIKEAFEEKDCTKLLSRWQKVDEFWMGIKGPLQISHPLEFYEDKYRKGVAPEWDLRILDTETLDSKVEENIKNMYEEIYNSPLLEKRGAGGEFSMKEKYLESYNFSKDNFNRVQLYISEPVLYFGSELNGLFSAQVVPNDEVVSEKFGKKIFAFPKMVLESKKKAPLMKLTKEILDENLLENYLKILEDDKLYFDIYDVETIGHEFGHTLWLTKDTEILMNKKTGNFKNIEEFKATAGGLCSYFMEKSRQTQGTAPTKLDFNKNIIIMHLVRCIGLLKYREVAEVLPYYNESLIHLEIMFEVGIFEIKNNKIMLKFSEENFEKLKHNYISHYKKLINIYLEKIDAGEFLFNYVVIDKSGNNVSKNKILQDFGNYYYDLYKKIGNEVV